MFSSNIVQMSLGDSLRSGKRGEKTYPTLKNFHLMARNESSPLHFNDNFEMLSHQVLVVRMHLLGITARIYIMFATVQNPHLSIHMAVVETSVKCLSLTAPRKWLVFTATLHVKMVNACCGL